MTYLWNKALERRMRIASLGPSYTERAAVVDRIADLCADADVRLDCKPGATLAVVKERLGLEPTFAALQNTHARLLRWVSLDCPADWEEA